MLTPPAALEALLFASGEPLDKKQLAKLLGITHAELTVALKALAQQLGGHGISIIETDGEIEMRTAPEASALVKKLRESELSRDLGKASMETLAVVAYHEGATRGEIDWVRGVNSSTSLRTLLMRGLIEGREDERDKRRVRYALTTEALAHLGICSANELPRFTELRAGAHAVVEAEKGVVEETV
ncbi:MAG: Condensin subunit ScpB [Parcubacteria group bacterium GW2011_GWA1_54_9]|nr:MAG: Condensin subunit ScpB [Parcubacteria group bacterium GW2011_GWA1_54_9]